MTIQWFPGHMAKTKREVKEKIKKIDIVLELVDARIPDSSRNPMVDEMAAGKPRLLLLNKADMADSSVTEQWQRDFQNQGVEEILTLNSQTGKGTDQIIPAAERLMHDKHEKMKAKGMNPRAIRALILGIPNVGKSTLINRLAGRRTAKVGDRPGITRQQQWIKVKGKLELLDTPGILWPKFEDQATGMRLAATGAIKDELFESQDVALFVLRLLKKRYPKKLMTRYQLEEIPEDDLELFDEIGRKRGCIIRGGEIDYDKAGALILRDLQTGKIGNLSLETPDDVNI
ncbi:MAG TPA: ribosome biogenesis GTPase YlqF [Bacillales bacterium]|nr:ribosome biogenesis GTPase YlqF [Bacillales bacterium]